MKLLFKQRFFSWFDSYDIYGEAGQVLYTVAGKLDWGHRLEIYDPYQQHLGTLLQRVLTFLPKFDLQQNGQVIGTLTKELTFLRPSFSLDCNGWRVDGNFMEWDYSIVDGSGTVIATIEKQLLNFTDTYTIDVVKEENGLLTLMVVLAIDALKCSQS